MTRSPLSASPYEVLAVPPSASQDELRRAYRRALRASHPDTGGSAAEFSAVQHAWSLVGTPEARARYDGGGTATANDDAVWAPRPPRRHSHDTRPRARVHGHPGGWQRQRYLTLIREWSGRGADLADPYDAAVVRSAPREIRHLLADALAEEATARALSTLGIGFTVWHDVAAGPRGGDDKLDHVVLGPTGVFAVQSEDWGGPVALRRGEVIGEDVAGRPLHELAGKARALGRQAKVRFSAGILVVPDDDFADPYAVAGSARGVRLVVTQSSSLLTLLRAGLPDTVRPGGAELFDVRTRLQGAIKFV